MCVVAVFVAVALLLKRFAGRYVHVKALAESFLSAVNIKGVLKDAAEKCIKEKCKKEKKEE